jgi:hypothetical protein
MATRLKLKFMMREAQESWCKLEEWVWEKKEEKSLFEMEVQRWSVVEKLDCIKQITVQKSESTKLLGFEGPHQPKVSFGATHFLMYYTCNEQRQLRLGPI